MKEILKQYNNSLNQKEEKIEELNNLCDKLLELELNEKGNRTSLLKNTDWKIIYPEEKRVTEKLKVAFVDEALTELTVEIEWLKNAISKLKREIELCDDKISLFKYTIRVLEQ